VTAALFLISFAWFLFYLNPTVYFGDCGELLCDVTKGFVPHPTGFPSYLLTATPLARFGTFAVHAHSAFWAALSVVLVERITRFSLTRSGSKEEVCRSASLVAAGALMGSCTLILHASCARVYTMQLAFLLVGILLTLGYRPHLRWALGWGLAAGFASGIHTLFLAIIPFTLIFLWDRRKTWVHLIPWAFCGFLLGASSHLWIPLRAALHPTVSWGEPCSFDAWWAYVTQSGYGFKLFSRGFIGTYQYFQEVLRFVLLEWNPFIWVFAMTGLLGCYKRDRFLGLSLLSIIGVNLALMWAYGGEYDQIVLYRYFLPTYAACALAAGWGWVEILQKFCTPFSKTWVSRGLLTVFLCLCVAVPLRRWRDLSISTDSWNYALNLLRSVPQDATLELASDNQIDPVAYAFYVKNLRPDLHLVEWNGTLFPETKRLLKSQSATTPLQLEKQWLGNNGGVLFLPEHREVPLPYTCISWGLSHRLFDSSFSSGATPPDMDTMPFRFSEAEKNDVESQDVLGAILLRRADQALERRDPAKAFADLKEAESLCSKNANVLVDLAVAYQKIGAVTFVEPLLLKAVHLRPHHYTGNLNLGLYYAQQGLYLRSIKHLRIAANSTSYNALALRFIRQVEDQMGKKP
jgi:tetratricopeptide (TPR) repeat protein